MRWAPRVARLLLLVLTATTAITATATVVSTAAGAQGAPRTLQDSLDAARRQRMALEATLERQLATGTVERARALAISNEANALQQLEALLDSAQARLVLQRDRIRLLKDAVNQTDKAYLVILFRADALPAGTVDVLAVVDGESQKIFTLSGERVRTLAAGAAEEVFRSEVTPTAHRLSLSVAGRGLAVAAPFSVAAAPREVRYVEFSLKGGRLVATTWTARASGY